MIDYVYILSAAQSGSTLLTMLLASHPDVASIGETSAVLWEGQGDTGLCSCGDPVGACSFWQRVRAGLNERGVRWNGSGFQTEFRMPANALVDRVLRAEYRGPVLEAVRDAVLLASPSWRLLGRSILECNVALVESAMAARGAGVFVDSSKEPHRLKHLLRAPSFKTKVLHLIRDGRGVSASYMRWNSWPIQKAVDEWRRSIASEEHMIRRLRAEQVLALRYEDLCADVEGELKRVFGFLGLDPSKRPTEFHSADHHVLGNRMRLQDSSEIKLDERWRTALTTDDLAEFERIGGRINRRYGYS